MMQSIQYVSPDELQQEFDDLESPEERIQFLIELGQTLPDFPKEWQTESNRVLGCQSMVWIVPAWSDGVFTFQASSDAPMVRGLVAVLMSVYSNRSPKEILDFPIESFFQGLQLKSFLSPMRSNGLHSMVLRIRNYAESMQSLEQSVSVKAIGAKPPDLGSIQDRIDQIRKDFPILSEKGDSGDEIAYLDNAASSQRPQSVIDAIDHVFQKHYANVHRSGHAWASETTSAMEQAREAVRRYVNAERTEEIIFTAGATASINLVANSWGIANLAKGDEILLSEMEHHSNIVPWQQLCQRIGCVIKWTPILPDYTLDLEQFKRLLSPRTKLVAIAGVSNVLGTINPVAQITKLAHSSNAVVLVDAAQSVPHGPIDVQDWDADFVVFSGHKMLASSGTGVCYGKKELLNSMPAWQGGGSMIKNVTFDGFSLADLPHKFEAGTPAIAEIISFKPAIEYLERIGKDRLMEHERMLVGRAAIGLSNLPRVKIFSPALERKSGVLSFSVDGIHGEEIARVLDAKGIAIRVGHHCAMPLHSRLGESVTCRASFYLYNTVEEVDRFVRAVEHAIQILS